ncbi:MAG TPA: sigma-54 dependent transcriptional regulator [Thermoanaerobaculia bacterium]
MALAGTRVLIVEDDAPLADALRDQLEEFGCLTTHAESVAEARRTLGDGDFEVALLDLQLPDGSGIDVLKQIVEDRLLTEAVVLTGYAEVSTAIQAIKLGAYDYLSKPARSEELELSVRKAAEKARLRRENLSLRVRLARHEPRVEGLVTEDKGMRALIDRLERAAQSELPILIEGESGTGKELFARAAHEKSRRSGQAFVAFNCAAVPENLLESELFGHEKGAFTGADRRRSGRFEMARGGTLFLDEVGELPPAVQAKVLRVLDGGGYERVGGGAALTTDARLVAATHRDLAAMVGAGEFRADLLYRLEIFPIALPSLAERPEDVPLLAAHLLAELARRHGARAPTPTPEALAMLAAREWPGNVRQLANLLERAVILHGGERLTPAALAELFAAGDDAGEPRGERERLRTALRATGGDKRRAAAELGISYRTLLRRVRAHDLEGYPRYRG